MKQVKPKLFGTDGIRGVFGRYPLDGPTVRRFGLVLTHRLAADFPQADCPHVVLGGDTRDSTPVLCQWLAAGISAGGGQVTYLGTVATPGVAHAAAELAATAGIAVSASHNPYPDNGIKLIDGHGFKWSSAAEVELEEQLLSSSEEVAAESHPLEVATDIVDSYLDKLVSRRADERPLAGLAIVLDAAHGAASAYAERAFVTLGARVDLIHANPDGSNINADSGSTHPRALIERVRLASADLGFAFDGDADRVIACDERGKLRDGDALLYLWGCDLHHRGELPKARLVATTMSNLGLEVALRREGIDLVRCDVGDREVVRTMQEEGLILGGEQSGHVVHLGLGTTGDGLLTALQIARLRAREGQPLSNLFDGFSTFPQLIENVRVKEKPDFEGLPRVLRARDLVSERLGESGRLVLRYSGTEPLARIMIEGRDAREIQTLASELASVLAEELS